MLIIVMVLQQNASICFEQINKTKNPTQSNDKHANEQTNISPHTNAHTVKTRRDLIELIT